MDRSTILSFQLMGMGMVGIFVVMLLIYLVIFILNKSTNNKADTEIDSKTNEPDDSVSSDDSEDGVTCAIALAVICEELHVGPDLLEIKKITEI